MHRSAIINVKATFAEFQEFILDMLGSAHNIAIESISFDPEKQLIVFSGKEDTSSTRRHTADLPLEALFGQESTVKKKGARSDVKVGLTGFLKKMFEEQNVIIAYPKIKTLCEQHGFAQGRTDTQIKQALNTIGVKQVEVNVYGFPKEKRIQEEELISS